MPSSPEKIRVVIIGANFAGLSAASKLDKRHQVTVIDSRDKFQWTPNIHEILSDVKKDTSLSLNLHTLIPRLGHQFLQETVTAIDGENQMLTLASGSTAGYDVLLIASGHTRDNLGVEGAAEHAYGFRTAQDVIDIHRRIEFLADSKQDRINVNIIGGGFTGVEVLGELLRKYVAKQNMHFHLIEAGNRLVQALPEKLSADIVSQCKDQRVSFYFEQSLSKVDKDKLYFEDGSEQTSDITIWTAGTQLPSYLDELQCDKNKRGIKVNQYLQTFAYPNIFIAGDCASLPDPCPKQASHALDMGVHAAKNINQFCQNKSLSRFCPSSKPVLLALGDINTYFVQGKLVLASPLLASAKEAIYQLWMARLSASLPIEDCIAGLGNRISLSTEKLLLPEILKLRPRVLIGRSKLL